MTMTTMMIIITMSFCLFPLCLMLCYFIFVNETNDIVDLANCYGGTERWRDGRTDTTSYRDAETHLKRVNRSIGESESDNK